MKPVLQALVLAERIYTDVSGKKIIAGTFNQLVIAKMKPNATESQDGTKTMSLPGGTDPGCPSAYISLTDVVDGTEISMQMVNVSKNVILFQALAKIASHDRLATVEIIAPLPPMAVFAREPGTLSFDLVWAGEILGSHRLIVSESNTDEPV